MALRCVGAPQFGPCTEGMTDNENYGEPLGDPRRSCISFAVTFVPSRRRSLGDVFMGVVIGSNRNVEWVTGERMKNWGGRLRRCCEPEHAGSPQEFDESGAMT
jgi:hypothetical protein